MLQALEHTPDYELALRNLALLQSRRGNGDTALQLLMQVTGEAQAHNDLGYLFLLDGQYERAATYFRRAVELAPRYYELAHRNLERAQALSREARRIPEPAPDKSRQARNRPVPVPASDPAPGVALDSTLFADDAAATGPTGRDPVATRRPVTPVTNGNVKPASTAGSEQPLYLKRWVNAGVLNVRDGDAPDARLLDRINRGRVVRVLREENGWAYVRYWEYKNDNISAREGWVHSDYLTDTQQRA